MQQQAALDPAGTRGKRCPATIGNETNRRQNGASGPVALSRSLCYTGADNAAALNRNTPTVPQRNAQEHISCPSKRITEVTDELVAAFVRLTPQLSSSNPAPTRAQLTEMVGSPAITLLVAREPDAGGEIVGSLTLAMFRIPTGLRAGSRTWWWIPQRGKGIGEALTRRGAAGGAGGRRDHCGSDLAAVTRGRQPALPAHRVREARDECLSLHADGTVECTLGRRKLLLTEGKLNGLLSRRSD